MILNFMGYPSEYWEAAYEVELLEIALRCFISDLRLHVFTGIQANKYVFRERQQKKT